MANKRKRIYIETRVYLTTVLVMLNICATFLLAFLIAVNKISNASWLVIPIFVFALLALAVYFKIFIPYKQMKHSLLLFGTGYSLESIANEENPLCPEMEMVQKRVMNFLNPEQLMSLSKRQAQFMVLQNQINPHFLYNTLDGIRSEALIAGLTNVASMAEALSVFFRYTISGIENLVTLQMELDNTQNYFFIQQYRFGSRLQMQIEIDEEDKETVLKYRIPKLTLQPIVENAIIHGLESKVGNGNVKIKVTTTSSRLLITVSDDGQGMDTDALEKIQNRLTFFSPDYVKNTNSTKRGGIALENVNNRIKLLFGEEYGLSISSIKNLGTDVNISLPRSIDTSGDGNNL